MRFLVAVAVCSAVAAVGEQPRFENARMETRALSGDLAQAIQGFVAAQSSPAWIGYTVPMAPGQGQACGWGGDSRTSHHLSLEGPTALFVLLRVEQKQIVKVRNATPDCEIDAGGLSVTWLTGVSAAASVSFLQSLIYATGPGSREQERTSDSAIASIAMHNDAAADRALDELAAQNRPEWLRRKAVFWLGLARGRHGYEKLARIVVEDTSPKIREHAVFALSRSPDPGAVGVILRSAREDKDPHVRGQALFWLAQSAQRKIAADAIATAIGNDPETEVKKKAVFALSQLPSGEGITKLIEVVNTNRNAAVRKQALFWLGQSKDPRALSYIEQILAR